MSKRNQTSDHAQQGPGLANPVKGTRENSSPAGIGEAGNAKSGTSQSHSRGKQGQ